MNSLSASKFSMLDLVAVRENGTVAEALGIARDTAQHVERLGFTRYWLAEHHNMPGIASSATAVLVGYIAAATSRIRVGSGGIMLPNHAPLVVAEAFGTLAELYPGRIDLGLGRAPGTDQQTMRALRRDRIESEADFPREVAELQQLLSGRARQTRKSLPCPATGPKCRSGCSVPACFLPAWRPNAVCLMPSRPISRRPCSCRRLSCIGATFNHRTNWPGLT